MAKDRNVSFRHLVSGKVNNLLDLLIIRKVLRNVREGILSS
jgi:hypothetical protein